MRKWTGGCSVIRDDVSARRGDDSPLGMDMPSMLSDGPMTGRIAAHAQVMVACNGTGTRTGNGTGTRTGFIGERLMASGDGLWRARQSQSFLI